MLRIGSILRKETAGGALLVVAAIIALIWANSPMPAGYFQLRGIRVGYGPWNLELGLGDPDGDGHRLRRRCSGADRFAPAGRRGFSF